ncbi:MAG TPA: hypothetical protein PLN56_11045 [Methanoregulaceae archaeon]|nr:MAG: hypothetical protein IPI71_09540 [Methanolinea sp.]HON82474.1 hypothetical protein [Methanoregulaceae archaeon]HPD11516.1 hypothetical protein [Methanoregulaceae archaeon]
MHFKRKNQHSTNHHHHKEYICNSHSKNNNTDYNYYNLASSTNYLFTIRAGVRLLARRL